MLKDLARFTLRILIALEGLDSSCFALCSYLRFLFLSGQEARGDSLSLNNWSFEASRVIIKLREQSGLSSLKSNHQVTNERLCKPQESSIEWSFKPRESTSSHVNRVVFQASRVIIKLREQSGLSSLKSHHQVTNERLCKPQESSIGWSSSLKSHHQVT